MLQLSLDIGCFFRVQRIIFLIIDGCIQAQCVLLCQQLDMLTWPHRSDVEVLGPLEHTIDIHREVFVRVHEHEEVQELGVIQKVESCENLPLIFKIFVGLLLKTLIVFCQLSVDILSICD